MVESAGDIATPDVTVVVVTYNSEDVLPGFFSSLAEATDGIDVTVVVADNASADRSVELSRELWPTAVVLASDENKGYAAGINAAMHAVPPRRALLVLNDDIRLAPGSVDRMLAALDEGGAGIVVPRLVDGEGHLLRSLRREPSVLRAFGEALLGGDRSGTLATFGEVVQDDASYDEPTTAAWASGCAWLIGMECWDGVGEWDESLFLYAEDIDYALRASDAGFRLRLEPSVTVTHLVGPSHRDPRLWSMSVWNKYRVYRRRHGAVSSFLFRSALFLNEAIRCGAGRSVHCAGARALLFRKHRPVEVR